MTPLFTKESYVHHFEEVIAQAGEERTALTDYVRTQVEMLTQLIETMTQETFWEHLPEILGIDAKLNLLTELLIFEDFPNEEILRIVETDYRSYFKELCGYSLTETPKPSMIFTIR